MNSEQLYQVIKAPHITEKSTLQQSAHNQYVFRVAVGATKPQIRQAVEQLFKVKVEHVNTTNKRPIKMVSGKTKGFTKAFKKAYVTLAAGQSIAVFNVSE